MVVVRHGSGDFLDHLGPDSAANFGKTVLFYQDRGVYEVNDFEAATDWLRANGCLAFGVRYLRGGRVVISDRHSASLFSLMGFAK